MKNKKIIAIIPAYNEASVIGKVVTSIKKYLPKVLVIDDCSSDETAAVAKAAGARVVSHVINQGVGLGQRTAFNIAFKEGYDYIVQLDADGQHDPKYIPNLLDYAIKNNFDIVIGSRFLNSSYKDYPLQRRIGIRFYSTFVNLLGRVNISDVTSGYRVYKVSSLKKLAPITERNWAIEQTLEAGVKGLRVGEFSVKMPIRKTGRSQFDFKMIFLYPFRMTEAILRVIIFRT